MDRYPCYANKDFGDASNNKGLAGVSSIDKVKSCVDFESWYINTSLN